MRAVVAAWSRSAPDLAEAAAVAARLGLSLATTPLPPPPGPLVLRAGVGRRELWAPGAAAPLRFHGGLGVIRVRRLVAGDHDVLVTACGLLPGDRVLDATAGACADALVLAHAVGPEGRVVTVESAPLLAELTACGLANPRPPDAVIGAALKRIELFRGDHADFLRAQPDACFDVVYLDPMFRKAGDASPGFDILRAAADPRPLSAEVLAEARRVARRRVVVRDRPERRELRRLGLIEIPGLSRTAARRYGMLPGGRGQ